MKQRKWLVLVLVTTVLVNGIGYLLFRLKKGDEPQALAMASTERAASRAGSAPSNVDPNADMVRARRAAGLAALESGDYDSAVDQFTQAARLSDQGDIAELLRIATDMKTRRAAKASPVKAPPTELAAREPAPPAPAKTVLAEEPAKPGLSNNSHPARPPKVVSRSRTGPGRSASRTPAAEDDSGQVPEFAPRQGLLLVTSTPPGMVVQVDGKTLDLTPARVNVRTGPHHVVLVYNDRRVLDETVDVPEDGVRSVNKELAPEVPAVSSNSQAVAPRPVPHATTAVGASASPGSSSNTVVSASARLNAGPTGNAAGTRPPGGGVTGDLVINSPGLYGEVWINDRPYGFPPVTASGLPVGKARVEIRIHGEVKRTLTAEVLPAQQTQVRVR